MTYIQDFIAAFISLLTIMNPLSAGTIMLSLMDEKELNKEHTRAIAMRASKTILIAILVTIALGGGIVSFFGINVYSIKIIGGTVLFLMAINMIHGDKVTHKHNSEEKEEAKEKDDISIIPLAIPILFGPGMMAVLISKVANITHWTQYITWSVAGIGASILTYFILSNMIYVRRFLGIIGIRIASRVMGLVVGALAAQFILEGLNQLLKIQ